MKSEIKEAFRKAASRYEARQADQQRAQESKVSERQRFEAEWRDVVDRIVKPALAQISREILVPASWTSEVKALDGDRAIALQIYKGTMFAQGTSKRPSITFTADAYSPKINVASQSITQGGGQGSVELSQVTEEFIQAKVLQLFERLTSGS